MREVQHVSASVVYKARIRADCVAMLVWRTVLQDLSVRQPGVNFYIFIDGSPQWRGLEMMASTLDVYDATGFTRRLLPLVSVSRDQLDTIGKAATLLWQLFLVTGSEFLRWVCSRVRAIVSDQGTEAGIANLTDILPEFQWMIRWGGATEPHVDKLFPRAPQVPGWKHLWDGLLQRSLSSLRFSLDF